MGIHVFLTAGICILHTYIPKCMHIRDAKFRLGRAFRGARTMGTGLMPVTAEAITVYYGLAAGLLAEGTRKMLAGLYAGLSRFRAAPVRARVWFLENVLHL